MRRDEIDAIFTASFQFSRSKQADWIHVRRAALNLGTIDSLGKASFKKTPTYLHVILNKEALNSSHQKNKTKVYKYLATF